jgi:hypothetical protein
MQLSSIQRQAELGSGQGWMNGWIKTLGNPLDFRLADPARAQRLLRLWNFLMFNNKSKRLTISA